MDRITRVRIENVRAIKSLDLELGRPATVLIGENGSGKSTVVECLELLRKAAEPSFMSLFYGLHRGLPGLLRKGATEMVLGVVVEDEAGKLPTLEYGFVIAPRATGAFVRGESLTVGRPSGQAKRKAVLGRSPDQGQVLDETSGKFVPVAPDMLRQDQLLIASFGNRVPHTAIERLRTTLRGIEVHLPFDTRASWAARTYQRPESLRASSTLFPAERLSLLGFNLANAWNELLSQPSRKRDHSLELLRLGLGERLDSVVIKPDAGGGNVHLALLFRDLAEPLYASELSDGQLTWLAFVAMAQLNPGRTLLAVDEPELHLHPALLGRVVSMLISLSGGAPLVFSTHSDRVLELLDDPVDAVRVCTLEDGCADVRRIDASLLPRWLDQFGDLGQVRAAGYLSRVLLPAALPAVDARGMG